MSRKKLVASKSLLNSVERLNRFLRVVSIFNLLFIFAADLSAQIGNGTSSPVKKDTSNNADQGLKSVAHVNPTTLAMELSIPLMNYPGRNGNSLPVGFSYSSKVWRMESGIPWWYAHQYSGIRQYVTDIHAVYGERSAAGWTSSLTPPRIDLKTEIYDQEGRPYSTSIDEAGYNALWQGLLQDFTSSNLLAPCAQCLGGTDASGECMFWVMSMCWINENGGGGGGGGGGIPSPPPPTVTQLYYVKRLQVIMGDGSSHEFRASDTPIHCGSSNAGSGCTMDMNGTYLSVDGSGMKLVRDSNGSTLYLPNGSRYKFPGALQAAGDGLYADEFTDNDGNKLTFTGTNTWTDTMGRTITDPLPHNWTTQHQVPGTVEIDLPGLSGAEQHYKIKWETLKPVGCETKTQSECGNNFAQSGTALEDQNQKLFYETRYFCQGNATTELLAVPNTPYHPSNEVLFPLQDNGIRPCNSFNVLRDAQGEPILDENGLAQPLSTRFNPTVLSEIELPNGKKYVFKYNRYGEISKIIYPTGSYETFEYDYITPLNGGNSQAYDQTNRGVTERRVYQAGSTQPEQRWKYLAELGKTTTIAPKGDDPMAEGTKTVRYSYWEWSDGSNYGFTSPGIGSPLEERAYDELGNLRSRTLRQYITKNSSNASRDPRVTRAISVTIENGQALATLSENEYDETGSADEEHFSHLNVKRLKGYHFAAIPLSLAKNENNQTIQANLEAIAAYFNSSLLASVSETDYVYDANYKARGIASLAVETRILNPSDLSKVVARTQTIYDNAVPGPSTNFPPPNYPSSYTLKDYGVSGSLSCPSATQSINCWTTPGSTALGHPTTSRVWDSDNNSWIETHTRYDIFGNAVSVKDAAGNEAQTIFENTTRYAYPTKVITSAPDPDNIHGTNEESTTETTYDFMTGLVKEVKNDFGQITKTEYDEMLRPKRVSGINGFIIPITETIYDDDALSVKVRKQIDQTNWDETTTYSDSLGRTIKTQAKDSQGDVFTEIEYDTLGRVKRTTNPYRAGDTKLWSKPRYDELGRTVESYAPAPGGQTGDSLGTTEYGISTAPGFIGTYVTTTDAAQKKSRAITNALGQLMVVDEPDYQGDLNALPQSTPNPSPTPTPTPGGGDGPGGGGCLRPENCQPGLTESDYPNYSTFYRYNEQGKMVEVVQGAQKRFFLYDSLGRLIRVRQPEQEVNPNLTTTKSIDGNNQWTAAFAYDVTSNVKRATDANGTNVINEYDKAKRIIRKCYTKQNIVTTAVNCSQVSSNDLDSNTPAVEYFYDGKGLEGSVAPRAGTVEPAFAKGKLTKVTSSISETRYTQFDYLGRLLQMEQRTPIAGETTITPHVSSYEYNFAGALVKETYPSGRVVQNDYEADGDLSRIYGKATSNSTERTYANAVTYTPNGKIEKLHLGNGRTEWAKFNNRLQVTEFGLGRGVTDATLWSLKYEYGELNSDATVNTAKNTGNIAKQTINFSGLPNPLVQTFKYDSLYRLIEARETANNNQSWKESFSYDRYGNRTGKEKFVGTTQLNLTNKTQPSINPLTNRFNEDQDNNGGKEFEYDKNGNLTQDAEGRIFVFNGDNKQRLVAAGGNNVGEYFYDGEGKRVKKIAYDNGVATEETVFVYSGSKLVAEFSTKPVATNPTTSYTGTDQLGSLRVITDSKGDVVSRRDFMPFGEEIINSTGERQSANTSGIQSPVTDLKYNAPDNVRQKFTGYQKDDETELDFAEARMYENRHGRFTAVDPLLASGKSANPQTFNRYVYVRNNPTVLTDPSGLCPDCGDPIPLRIWSPSWWEPWMEKLRGGGKTETEVTRDFINNFKNTESENFAIRKRGSSILSSFSPTASSSEWAPTGTPEQVKEFEDTMSNEPTGAFNLIRASYRNSIGQASNGELLGAYLGFGTNLIPGGQSGKQTVKYVAREGGEEIFYRAMSMNAAKEFFATGKIPISAGENMLTTSLEYAQRYRGVIFEISVKPGTTRELLEVGVRNEARRHPFYNLPIVSSGWKENNVFFKIEDKGQFLNMGIGNGRGRDMFNSNIERFRIVNY
jgi:RHS repeat-associated protein